MWSFLFTKISFAKLFVRPVPNPLLRSSRGPVHPHPFAGEVPDARSVVRSVGTTSAPFQVVLSIHRLSCLESCLYMIGLDEAEPTVCGPILLLTTISLLQYQQNNCAQQEYDCTHMLNNQASRSFSSVRASTPAPLLRLLGLRTFRWLVQPFSRHDQFALGCLDTILRLRCFCGRLLAVRAAPHARWAVASLATRTTTPRTRPCKLEISATKAD